MPPLVSIIIPCYNAEKFVEEAIQSALAQSYAARFFHLPEVLHMVRGQHANVYSNEVRVLHWRQKVLCDSFQNLAERAELTEERRAAFASLMAHSGCRLVRHGDRKNAKELFRTALQMHPGGGLAGAYSPFGYWLARLLGPQRAEPILLPLKKAASAGG